MCHFFFDSIKFDPVRFDSRVSFPMNFQLSLQLQLAPEFCDSVEMYKFNLCNDWVILNVWTLVECESIFHQMKHYCCALLSLLDLVFGRKSLSRLCLINHKTPYHFLWLYLSTVCNKLVHVWLIGPTNTMQMPGWCFEMHCIAEWYTPRLKTRFYNSFDKIGCV